MKRILFILFFCSLFLNIQESRTQSGKGSTYYEWDSTTVQLMTDSVPRPIAGKFRTFFAVGTDGFVHPYKMTRDYRVNRMDSLRIVDSVYRTAGKDTIFVHYNTGETRAFKDSTGGGGSGGKRSMVYSWYNFAQVDSQIFWEVDTTLTLDSLRVISTGASSVVVNAKRVRSGTPADLLSSNYTATSSLATPTGLQNNSLLKNDVLWVMIRSISGTATYVYIQMNFH